MLRIWDHHGHLLVKVNHGLSRLYVLHLEAKQPLPRRKEYDDARRWHERFGHLHLEALHQLNKQSMVRGIPVIKHDKPVCDTYVKYRVHEQLELVRSDLCGPVTMTKGGRHYFLLLVDDASHYMWAV